MTLSEYKNNNNKKNIGNQYSLRKNQFKFSIITLKRTNIPVLMYIPMTFQYAFVYWISSYDQLKYKTTEQQIRTDINNHCAKTS